MSHVANRIVQKLWSYCQVLRDDGLSYQDYLGQLSCASPPASSTPRVLAQQIAADLRSALAQIEDVLADLESRADGGAAEEA
jgi:hypothetical protein